MKFVLVAGACILAAFCAQARPAQAAVVMTFVEQGADVVGTLSGSLNISGISTFSAGKFGSGVTPSLGGVFFGPSEPSAISFLHDFEGYTFGTGAYSFTTSTGSPFAILASDNQVFLPNGYTSGGSLSGSMTFANTDFATLGIVAGTDQFMIATGDTITVTFQTAAIPVPPAIAALGTGLLGLGLWGRRRRG